MKTNLFILMSALLLAGGGFVACDNSNDDEFIVTPPAYTWPDGKRFYYYSGEKIYLDQVPDKFVVLVERDRLSEIEQHLQASEQALSSERLGSTDGFLTLTVTEGTDLGTIRGRLSGLPGVKSVNPIYTPAGVYPSQEIMVTDEFIVLFKKNVSQEQIDRINEMYHIQGIRKSEWSESVVLSVPANFDALEVSNAYWESGLVEFAEPNPLLWGRDREY